MLRLSLCILFSWLLCNIYAQQTPSAQLQELISVLQQPNPIIKTGEKPEDIISKNMFVIAKANKQTAYIGEPVMVTYKFYTRLKSESSMGKQPTFNGCSVHELDVNSEPVVEDFDGKPYHALIIREIQITPLQEGDLVLEEATVNSIIQLAKETDPYDFESYSATISSKPITIHILPLPEVKRPANFTGTIGHFSITAKADSNNVPAGENITLHVTISGTGNFDAITLPSVTWPAATEHFDATDTQHIDQQTFPIKGYKQFNIPFIAKQTGMLVIPAITYTYFDNTTNSYTTITSDSIHVNIIAAVTKEEVLQQTVTEDVSNRKYLWIVGALAILVAVVIIVTSAKHKKPAKALTTTEWIPPAPITKKEKIAANTLLQQLQTTEDDIVFFTLGKEILIKILQQQLNTGEHTEHNLLQLTLAHYNNEQLTADIKHFFKQCNHYLYAAITTANERGNLFDELQGIVNRLETT
jgi:hypothetical protein